VILAWAALGVLVYAYAGYPLLLLVAGAARRRKKAPEWRGEWPELTIVVPVHNEAVAIGATLEALLATDYPADRRRILVVSDASTDGTDVIVSEYAGRGVRLLRLPERGGKTAAENAARGQLAGDIVVNTDASVRVHPAAIKPLVRALADPSVGVASGRDVSVAPGTTLANAGESAYVGYEMWVRDLETQVSGIVGASGCLYAIRGDLYREPVPPALSRDFAAALVARERGLRAVSVPEAVCFVPRGASLRQEYRRKVRTMARGLATLGAKRHLLDPTRHGAFAWMLASHKLIRWLVPWSAVLFVVALAAAAPDHPLARLGLAAAGAGGLLALLGWLWPEGRPLPRLVALAAFGAGGMVAGLHAWLRALAGRRTPVWEPTRRGPMSVA